MPIKIPSHLPARATLEAERIPLIDNERALRQDIRPLQIALLNLMPDKIGTETQLLRAIGATPLQIEMTLLRIAGHTAKNTPEEHLQAFYETLDDVHDRRFDALIVTGAPVENLPYEDVTYWRELQTILDWAATHVYSSFFICWGAQAALFHYHGVPKHPVPAKRFGIFSHRILDPFHPLTAGFDEYFAVPVSRHTEINPAEAGTVPGLTVLAEARESGLCLAYEETRRRVYMFNHLEYDAETLAHEYFRDAKSGLGTALPSNYFPGNDPTQPPRMTWRAHRTLLFSNWINMVYQGTPYDLGELEKHL